MHRDLTELSVITQLQRGPLNFAPPFKLATPVRSSEFKSKQLWFFVVRRDLTERGLWTPEVRNQIIADQGSVQNVRQIPQELKDLYKTVWEIKQKFILNQVRTPSSWQP